MKIKNISPESLPEPVYNNEIRSLMEATRIVRKIIIILTTSMILFGVAAAGFVVYITHLPTNSSIEIILWILPIAYCITLILYGIILVNIRKSYKANTEAIQKAIKKQSEQ